MKTVQYNKPDSTQNADSTIEQDLGHERNPVKNHRANMETTIQTVTKARVLNVTEMTQFLENTDIG